MIVRLRGTNLAQSFVIPKYSCPLSQQTPLVSLGRELSRSISFNGHPNSYYRIFSLIETIRASSMSDNSLINSL